MPDYKKLAEALRALAQASRNNDMESGVSSAFFERAADACEEEGRTWCTTHGGYECGMGEKTCRAAPTPAPANPASDGERCAKCNQIERAICHQPDATTFHFFVPPAGATAPTAAAVESESSYDKNLREHPELQRFEDAFLEAETGMSALRERADDLIRRYVSATPKVTLAEAVRLARSSPLCRSDCPDDDCPNHDPAPPQGESKWYDDATAAASSSVMDTPAPAASSPARRTKYDPTVRSQRPTWTGVYEIRSRDSRMGEDATELVPHITLVQLRPGERIVQWEGVRVWRYKTAMLLAVSAEIEPGAANDIIEHGTYYPDPRAAEKDASPGTPGQERKG